MKPALLHLVAARSDSGKTVLIEKLLPRLKQRGIRTAVLKGNQDHYQLDRAGKDSERYARAGAEAAGVAGKKGFFISVSSGEKTGLEAAAETLQGFDLILVEGDKQTSNPKIELVRSVNRHEPLLLPGVIALVSDRDYSDLEIPFFHIDDIEAITGFIVDNFLSS